MKPGYGRPLQGLMLMAVCLFANQAMAASDGMALYRGKCAMCHGPAGAGRPGTFPPLAGRVDRIAATAGGRTYLASVLLNGLHGPITAEGQSYKGYMPSFRSLSDDDIAAVLAYAATLGGNPSQPEKAPAVSATEVSSVRAKPMAADAILQQRQALDGEHSTP